MSKIAVFLGAGASAELGLPLMNTFCDAVRDSDIPADEIHDFDAVHNYCNRLAALIGQSARNLENLMSFLSLLEIASPSINIDHCKIYKTPEEALNFVISLICERVMPDIQIHKLSKMAALLAELSKHRAVIITTNYDMHVELTCYRHRLPIAFSESVNNTYRRAPLGEAIHAEAPLSLYKLHGSANWTMDSAGQLSCSGSITYPDPNSINVTKPTLVSRGRQLIIPPAAIKNIQHGVLREQWNGAHAALRTAEHIWFIGYSFPETDSYMRYFIASAVAGNPRLRQIVVIDPSEETLYRRAASFFASAQFSDVFFPLEKRFGEIDNWALMIKNRYLQADSGHIPGAQATTNDKIVKYIDWRMRTAKRG